MILKEIREVRIASLVLPGTFAALCKTAEVQDLAVSIRDTGMVELPAVEHSTRRVIYGLKRIAAHRVLQRETFLVQMVELEEGEDRDHLRLASNGPKRPTDMSKVRALFDAKVIQLAEQNPGVRLRGPGNTKTIEGMAADELAKELGIKARSFKVRQRRAQKRDSRPPPPMAPVNEIDLMGAYADPAWLKRTAELRRHYTAAIKLLAQAAAQLAAVAFVGERERVMADDLRDTRGRLAGLTPISVCPFCKLVPEVMAECGRCVGKGWIGADGPVTPVHLLDRDAPVVNYRGKAVPVADFIIEDRGAEHMGAHEFNEGPFDPAPDGEEPDQDPNNGAEISEYGDLDEYAAPGASGDWTEGL